MQFAQFAVRGALARMDEARKPHPSWPGLSRPSTPGRRAVGERYEDIANAIERERNMKHWPLAWKVRLILETNPERRDLYDQLNA